MPKYSQNSYLGGTQIRTNKFLVRPGELILAQNVSGEIVGSWKTRLGFIQTGDTLESGKNILGLFGFEQEDGTDKHLAVANNSNDSAAVLQYNNSGSWTAIGGATSFPANASVNFFSFLDKAYIFGANSSHSYLTSGTLDGTTYSQDSTLPKARYGVEFFDRLYLADCEVSGIRYSNRIYYSSIPTYSGGWDISFTTATNFLQPATQDGDYITGLAKSFNRLLVLKNYSIHSWDLVNLNPVENVGCTAPRSIVNLGNLVFFFSYTAKKKGWYMWDGSSAKKISRPIDPFIEGMADSSVAVGGVYQDKVYLFIGNVTLNSDIADYYGIPASYSNVLLEYDFANNQHIVHTLPVPVKVMAEHNNNLYFGDNTGKVYQWASGTTDDGTAVEATIITHNYYGQPADKNNRKVFNELGFNFHKPNTAQLFYSIDNNDFQPVGQATQKVNVYTIGKKGYGIRRKITSNSSDFIWEGDEIDYTSEGRGK